MDGEVRQEVAKQLVKGYLVHMLVYIVVVLAFLGIAYRWCGSQVWYPWDELYPLVKSCGFKSRMRSPKKCWQEQRLRSPGCPCLHRITARVSAKLWQS